VFVWRSPLGGIYQTRGEFLTPHMPELFPIDHGPEPDLPPRVDGPILQPRIDRREPEPPRPPLPDEPPF